MPPNPERQEKMRAKREAMANDPKLAEAAAAAGDAVLGRDKPDFNIRTPDEQPIANAPNMPSEDEQSADAEKKRSPPPLSAPPIGRPTVPSQPQIKAPSMKGGLRGGLRGGGGMGSSGPVHTITPKLRADMPNFDRKDPLGLGPNSKFTYAQGGKVLNNKSWRK